MEEQSINQNEFSMALDGTKVMDSGATATVIESGSENITSNNVAQDDNSQNPFVKQDSVVSCDDTHSLGKFKSVDELQKAYKSLEAEFTKRSQRLKEYESNEKNSKMIPWEERVDNFVAKNPLSKEYAKEITDELVGDDELLNDPNCLEKAYLRILERNIKPYDKIINDEEFLERYVFSSDKIKEKIITEYLSNIASRHPYNLIGDGGNFAVNVPNKPKSIKDCGEMVEKMFN